MSMGMARLADVKDTENYLVDRGQGVTKQFDNLKREMQDVQGDLQVGGLGEGRVWLWGTGRAGCGLASRGRCRTCTETYRWGQGTMVEALDTGKSCAVGNVWVSNAKRMEEDIPRLALTCFLSSPHSPTWRSWSPN